MENLINNPNLSIDIGQKILQILDVKSLQTFRLVNSSMKQMVDQPRVWLRKLKKKGLNPKFNSKELNDDTFVQENLLNWGKLIDNVKGKKLEKNVTICLIKMHQNFPIPQYQVPIYVVSKFGDANLVELILEQIPKLPSRSIDDFIGPNAFDKSTPIWIAALKNHIEVVELLVNSTDNPNAPRNDGTTPISFAAQENHIEILKLLMKSTNNPNAPKNDGTTPIYIAAQKNHIEIVKLLMKSTDNPNAPCNDGTTPIFIAAKKNHIEIVKLLMKSTDNPNAPRNDGTTPISIAAQKNNLEIVQLLVNYILPI